MQSSAPMLMWCTDKDGIIHDPKNLQFNTYDRLLYSGPTQDWMRKMPFWRGEMLSIKDILVEKPDLIKIAIEVRAFLISGKNSGNN